MSPAYWVHFPLIPLGHTPPFLFSGSYAGHADKARARARGLRPGRAYQDAFLFILLLFVLFLIFVLFVLSVVRCPFAGDICASDHKCLVAGRGIEEKEDRRKRR